MHSMIDHLCANGWICEERPEEQPTMTGARDRRCRARRATWSRTRRSRSALCSRSSWRKLVTREHGRAGRGSDTALHDRPVSHASKPMIGNLGVMGASMVGFGLLYVLVARACSST